MIAATVRLVTLAVAGLGGLAAGLHYLLDRQAPETVLCLLLSVSCLSYSGYVRRTADHLRELHDTARRAADADGWLGWCCDTGFLTGGRDHTNCTGGRS